MHQQLLLHKLPLHLAQLHGTHAAAIGRKLARSVFLQCHQQFFRRRRRQSGKEFFFENGEGPLQCLKIACCAVVGFIADFGGELAETGGGCAARFGSHDSGIQSGCGRFKMCGNARVFKAGLAGSVVGLAVPAAASRSSSAASITACAHQARPLIRLVRAFFWRASYLSKAASMPRSAASSGMPASRQVSIRAQSSVESSRSDPRRCWKRSSISVK